MVTFLTVVGCLAGGTLAIQLMAWMTAPKK